MNLLRQTIAKIEFNGDSLIITLDSGTQIFAYAQDGMIAGYDVDETTGEFFEPKGEIS